MESQLGLVNVWTQGDWVTKTVALILLVMSLATWIVILIKALGILKYKKLAKSNDGFWHSEDLVTGLTNLGGGGSNPFRQFGAFTTPFQALARRAKPPLTRSPAPLVSRSS